MGNSVPDVQASHLRDSELLSCAEFYWVKYHALPPAMQEELLKRFREQHYQREDAKHQQ